MNDMDKSDKAEAAPTESPIDTSRRETLERLGKYAAPVMLALLLAPRQASAQSTLF